MIKEIHMTDKNPTPRLAFSELENKPVRKRRLLIMTVLGVMGIAAVVAAVTSRPDKGSPGKIFQIVAVSRGDMAIMVAATGNLEPTNQVDVGSELSGTIQSVAVEDNDQVKAGQVLARLNTDKIKAQVWQEQAGLASANAQVLYAEATVKEAKNQLARLQRVRELSHNKTPSIYDLDTAEAILNRAVADQAVAMAKVSEAKARLNASETDLRKSTILSPINGVVLIRSSEPGQTVAASFQAPVLFTLAENLTQMELHVYVDEADVGQVFAGQKATFTVDAYPDHTFHARIIRVRYGAESSDGVVTYKTVLGVNNADGILRPGMTATAEIIVTQLKDVLIVPNTALRFSPRGQARSGKKSNGLISSLISRPSRSAKKKGSTVDGLIGKRIWIFTEGSIHPEDVKTGPTDGIRTVIESKNLETGAMVVVGRKNTSS